MFNFIHFLCIFSLYGSLDLKQTINKNQRGIHRGISAKRTKFFGSG
ncbi:MAG: hypothetical protein HW410_847 [Nitrosarchaeum sp.]|nr:hypothetical protein [Nitrosarchaeum sp.]